MIVSLYKYLSNRIQICESNINLIFIYKDRYTSYKLLFFIYLSQYQLSLNMALASSFTRRWINSRTVNFGYSVVFQRYNSGEAKVLYTWTCPLLWAKTKLLLHISSVKKYQRILQGNKMFNYLFIIYLNMIAYQLS